MSKKRGMIIELTRLRNSPSGNPRHRVTFVSDGISYTLPTSKDSQIGSLIRNTEFHEGLVDFTIANQEIIRAEPVE